MIFGHQNHDLAALMAWAAGLLRMPEHKPTGEALQMYADAWARDIKEACELHANNIALREQLHAPFVEQMLAECLPGGASCDPQFVADSIRAWAEKRGFK